MAAAISVYKQAGFVSKEPYYETPNAGTFARPLQPDPADAGVAPESYWEIAGNWAAHDARNGGVIAHRGLAPTPIAKGQGLKKARAP